MLVQKPLYNVSINIYKYYLSIKKKKQKSEYSSDISSMLHMKNVCMYYLSNFKKYTIEGNVFIQDYKFSKEIPEKRVNGTQKCYDTAIDTCFFFFFRTCTFNHSEPVD
jgi:hypothetical protein